MSYCLLQNKADFEITVDGTKLVVIVTTDPEEGKVTAVSPREDNTSPGFPGVGTAPQNKMAGDEEEYIVLKVVGVKDDQVGI